MIDIKKLSKMKKSIEESYRRYQVRKPERELTSEFLDSEDSYPFTFTDDPPVLTETDKETDDVA